MDLNKAMIIGRLTRDPELKTTPSGVNVCQIGLATNFVYTNQQTGQKVENVEYHNIVLWRKLADIANQYLKKGQRVYIEGRLQTRSWDDQQTGKKAYKTEIIADNMIMLDGGRGDGPSNGGGNFAAGAGAGAMGGGAASSRNENSYEELPTIQQGEDINVDDIPF